MDQAAIANVFLLCTVNVLFMIAGICLNSVVIISLWRSSQLRNKTCYFMIFVMSCFDLSAVVINHPLLMASEIVRAFGDYDKLPGYITSFIVILSNAFSMAALLTLNIERFLAVSYPFLHERVVTKEKLMSFQAFLSFIAIGLVTLTFNKMVLSRHLLVAVYLPGFFIFFICLNYKTFLVANSKRKSIKVAPANEQKRKLPKLNLQTMSTCSLAVYCYLVCASPEIIHSFFTLITTTDLSRTSDRIFCTWAVTFLTANSTFNCLILFWRNTVLRREGMKIIKNIQSSWCCFQLAGRLGNTWLQETHLDQTSWTILQFYY